MSLPTAATAEFMDRLLDPVGACLTPEVARRLVSLRADPEVQARIDTLAERANEGRLTDGERTEYETYVRTITLIAQLQAKARRVSLNQAGPATAP